MFQFPNIKASNESGQKKTLSSYNREQDMELEIENLKYSVNTSDQEKDRMQAELEKKDKRLREMEAELSKHFDEMGKLQSKNQELEQSLSQKNTQDQGLVLQVPQGAGKVVGITEKSQEKGRTPEN